MRAEPVILLPLKEGRLTPIGAKMRPCPTAKATGLKGAARLEALGQGRNGVPHK